MQRETYTRPPPLSGASKKRTVAVRARCERALIPSRRIRHAIPDLLPRRRWRGRRGRVLLRGANLGDALIPIRALLAQPRIANRRGAARFELRHRVLALR